MLACTPVVFTLIACTSVAPPAPKLPEVPAEFRGATAAGAAKAGATNVEPPSAETSWNSFSDPVLDNLVARAERGNTSIQLAAARLEKARSLIGAAEANRMPQAGLGAGVNRQGGPLINAAGGSGSLWTASANASYEVDLFGRYSKDVSAASLDAQAREALLQSARLIVQADVAQSYFAIRALDAERTVVRETLGAYQKTLQLTERRFELGSVAELDVARMRADVAAAESESLALDRRRAELEHGLAALLGEVASSFRLEEAAWNTVLPVVPAGIPSTVLARRPDIAAAQRTMLAAQARLGIAESAWFPSLSLTTGQGLAAPNWRDLIALSARTWSAGVLLSLPLLDGGRREAGVRGAAAELEGNVASYREQILLAFKEVEDQLSSLHLLADQAQAQARAVAAATRASSMASSRYSSGLASQLDLLDAQRSELRNRRLALQVRLAQYQSTVALIRALGGGWMVTASR